MAFLEGGDSGGTILHIPKPNPSDEIFTRYPMGSANSFLLGRNSGADGGDASHMQGSKLEGGGEKERDGEEEMVPGRRR